MKHCIRCFKEIQEKEFDGNIQYNAIEIPKFNNLGLDEGMLCDSCQGTITVVQGSGIKAHGFLTNHPRLSCERCGYSWEAESAKLPGTCPNKKCRSPYWMKPRQVKGNVAEHRHDGTWHPVSRIHAEPGTEMMDELDGPSIPIEDIQDITLQESKLLLMQQANAERKGSNPNDAWALVNILTGEFFFAGTGLFLGNKASKEWRKIGLNAEYTDCLEETATAIQPWLYKIEEHIKQSESK